MNRLLIVVAACAVFVVTGCRSFKDFIEGGVASGTISQGQGDELLAQSAWMDWGEMGLYAAGIVATVLGVKKGGPLVTTLARHIFKRKEPATG